MLSHFWLLPFNGMHIYYRHYCDELWSRGRTPDCQSRDGDSFSPTADSKLTQFRSPHICLGLSDETLKAGGPFYLVSMPGGVKDPTRGVYNKCVTCNGLTHSGWTLKRSLQYLDEIRPIRIIIIVFNLLFVS